MNKSLYDEAKSKGLCIMCNKRNTIHGVYCEECKVKRKEAYRLRRDYLIKRNLCVVCGKEEIFKGNKCVICREKMKEKSKLHYIKNKEKYKKRNEKLVWERKESGLCVRCGKAAQSSGKFYCSKCLKVIKRYRAKAKENKGIPIREFWKENNWCYFCGEKELVKGKKVCVKCYQVLLERVEKMKKAKMKKDIISKHIWRKINTVDLEKIE